MIETEDNNAHCIMNTTLIRPASPASGPRCVQLNSPPHNTARAWNCAVSGSLGMQRRQEQESPKRQQQEREAADNAPGETASALAESPAED